MPWPQDNCGTCLFFLKDASKPGTGFCRRHPPTPILVGMGQSAVALPNGNTVSPIIQPFFPQMMEREGWCGDHKPKFFQSIGEGKPEAFKQLGS